MRVQEFRRFENGGLDLRAALFSRRIRGLPAYEFSSAHDNLKFVINFLEQLLGNSCFVMM
jgi:hypothetical protein